MRTFKNKEMRRAKEGSKRWGGTWDVEEVVKGRGKGVIQANPRGENDWWSSSVVKVIATYDNGIRK